MHQDIFTHELEAWRSRGARLIDVREPDEYAAGHIPAALNIPLSSLELRAGELLQDPETPLVMICRSGNRSRSACEYLEALGHGNLANLQGGTATWAQEGRPLEVGA
ncbi:MAG: rhodanese-like domain-containing protein [Deinococcales bacterium]